MINTLAAFTADTSLISDSVTAIGAIVAACLLAYGAKFALPVAQTVYRSAVRVLRG